MAGLLAAVAAMLLLGLAPLAAPALAAKQREAKPIFWGAQIGHQLTGEAAPWDMGAVYKFQAMAGKPLSLISFSAPFADCTPKPCVFNGFPTTPMENARTYGAVPMFSWGSEGSTGSASEPAFSLKRVADGAYDSYIRTFAEGAREWGHPFFLRFDWEMNGFWFPWGAQANHNTPHQFVVAWRHVHRIFDSVGATNATWVWCPNVDFTRKLSPLNALYPGNRWVDWTCLDGFNWGKTPHSIGWQSFDEVFHSTYKRVLKIAPGKPMMLGELASDERGGSKSSWIKQTLKTIPAHYPKIRGLIWYEERDQGMRWPIESSKGATHAFAAGIARQVYRPNLYGGLADGLIVPPSWEAPPIEPAPLTAPPSY